MDHSKEIVRLLEGVNTGRWMMLDVFADFCRLAALSVESPFTSGDLKREIEDEYARIIAKYDGNHQPFSHAMAEVVAALNEKREEFLGKVHEAIGAANTRNGQFFTPNDVANVMARVTATPGLDYRPGRAILLNDPACGASVTLIAGAEALLERGVNQRDIFIDAGDIDRRALDMSYVELSLLGYAAVVRHENALTRQVLSRPRFTPGYFLHGFPMRVYKLGKQVA